MKKLYHVVMEHDTVTFLDEEARTEFAGRHAASDVRSVILCESDVTEEELARAEEWAAYGRSRSAR